MNHQRFFFRATGLALVYLSKRLLNSVLQATKAVTVPTAIMANPLRKPPQAK